MVLESFLEFSESFLENGGVAFRPKTGAPARRLPVSALQAGVFAKMPSLAFYGEKRSTLSRFPPPQKPFNSPNHPCIKNTPQSGMCFFWRMGELNPRPIDCEKGYIHFSSYPVLSKNVYNSL
jgi:hypothetical protein